MQVNDDMVRAAAEVFCDNGIHIALPQDGDLDDLERERYDTLRAALTAALAHMWRPIETAAKSDKKFGQPIIRLWDGKRERHGYWDTHSFARKPRPYWHYIDSIAVSNDRAAQPTHWAPLLPAPPRTGGE